MKRYEPDDELVALYVRLRHETLPIYPVPPVVELPDGSGELDEPRDALHWQDTAPLPVVPPGEPSLATMTALVLIVLAGLLNGGYWLGVWMR